MNRDDQLRALLREADQGAKAPVSSPDAVSRAARRVREAQRREGIGRTCAALVLAVGGAVFAWQGGGGEELNSGGDALGNAPAVVSNGVGGQQPGRHGLSERAALESELAQLAAAEREAEAALRVARRTDAIVGMGGDAARVERRRAQPEVFAYAPIVQARVAAESAAAILLEAGDTLCFQHDLCDTALERYRLVVESFPRTASAVTARSRLDRFGG